MLPEPTNTGNTSNKNFSLQLTVSPDSSFTLKVESENEPDPKTMAKIVSLTKQYKAPPPKEAIKPPVSSFLKRLDWETCKSVGKFIYKAAAWTIKVIKARKIIFSAVIAAWEKMCMLLSNVDIYF